MVRPEQFLDVARRLEGSELEVERRTAVGRAYYAAFNFARRKIEESGGVVPSGRAHHCVLHYLRDTQRAAAGQDSS